MSDMSDTSPVNARVLVVDDEALVGMLVADLLRAENLEVSLALKGEEALEMARAHGPDLVVMDWKMPGLSGAELLRALRLVQPGLPVVVFSGYDLTRERLGEVGGGPEPVLLRKAVELDLLVPAVVEMARGGAAPVVQHQSDGRAFTPAAYVAQLPRSPLPLTAA